MPMITLNDVLRHARIVAEAVSRMARAEAKLAQLQNPSLDVDAEAVHIANAFLAEHGHGTVEAPS